MKLWKLSLLCCSAVLIANSALGKQPAPAASGNLFQVSTIYALESGFFEGAFSYADLMKKGDLGVGTFTGIDGELVAVDGQFFQSTPDCHLQKVSSTLKAPFAEVIHFHPSINAKIQNSQNFRSLNSELMKLFPNPNLPYAIRIDGVFRDITVRSLPKQQLPYPDLLTASKKQQKLHLKNVKGTAVGFWFPHYWEGIGMPVVHLHFASADRQLGGHVLEIAIDDAQVQLQAVQNVQVYLPNTPAFSKIKLDDINALEKDVEQVEGLQ